MSRSNLEYMSAKELDTLSSSVADNIQRYRDGDFADLVHEGGWRIKLSLEVDLDPLKDLDPSGGPEAEVANSLRVWKALHNLTPAQACEDCIWTRLSHVECLEYSRKRWLSAERDDNQTVKNVRTHFFAPGLTACRDDHAISRLWWNARIAKNLRPTDQQGALKLLLKTADIRSNLVERPSTGSRSGVAAAILDLMEREPWVTAKESNYREFMKVVNRRGGGVVFELQSPAQLTQFMDECHAQASAA